MCSAVFFLFLIVCDVGNSICEVFLITRGPVVTTVAFIGYLVHGVPRATGATLGIFLPVYFIVILLAP